MNENEKWFYCNNDKYGQGFKSMEQLFNIFIEKYEDKLERIL